MPERTFIKLEQLQKWIAWQILRVNGDWFVEFSDPTSSGQNIDWWNASSLYTPSLILDWWNA